MGDRGNLAYLRAREKELKKALKKRVAREDILAGRELMQACAIKMAEARKSLGLYMEVG